MKLFKKNILNLLAYADVQAQEYFDWASLPICSSPNHPTFNTRDTVPKFGILLVAYGSSHFQGSSALRHFQGRMEQYFNVPVRIAFTSETMRKRLAHARTKSDSVLKALQKMNFEKFTHVAVQSLHLISGVEYYDVLGDIQLAKESMSMNIEAGFPLLSTSEDVLSVATALLSLIPEGFGTCDKLVWMGHGTSHEAEQYYVQLTHAVRSLDSRCYIACMTGVNTLDTVFEEWKKTSLHCCHGEIIPLENKKYGKVWLLPLLTLIGRHALHDMAGDQESSWKKRIESAGYLCEVHLHGLVESESMQNIWIERLCMVLHRF